jgi:hypothetical protein
MRRARLIPRRHRLRRRSLVTPPCSDTGSLKLYPQRCQRSDPSAGVGLRWGRLATARERRTGAVPGVMPAHRIYWRCIILIIWRNKADALNGCFAGEDALPDALGRLWHPGFI